MFLKRTATARILFTAIPFQRRLRQGRREAHPRRVLQVLRLQRLPQECRSVLLQVDHLLADLVMLISIPLHTDVMLRRN